MTPTTLSHDDDDKKVSVHHGFGFPETRPRPVHSPATHEARMDSHLSERSSLSPAAKARIATNTTNNISTSKLTQIEKDAWIKQRSRSQGQARSTPGAVASASQSLAHLDRVISDRSARKSAGVTTTTEATTTATANDATIAFKVAEQDIVSKRQSHGNLGPALQPGATFVTPDKYQPPVTPAAHVARLDGLVSKGSAKDSPSFSTASTEDEGLEMWPIPMNHGNSVATASPSKSDSTSSMPHNVNETLSPVLVQMELDIEGDLLGRSPGGACSAPGVYSESRTAQSSPTDRLELQDLEVDYGRCRRSSARILRFDTGITSGLIESDNNESLRSLETDLRGNETSKVAVLPTSENTATLSPKAASRVTETRVREGLVEKSLLNDSAGALHVSDEDQHASFSKDALTLESGLADPHAVTSDADLEFGVYGLPTENGLAVAFAVTEEESEDMFIPSAVEFDPDAKPPIYHNRRFRLYACLAIVVILAGTVASVVGILFTRDETTTVEPPQLPYRATIGIREAIEDFVGNDQLEDPSNPYRKALDWIQDVDPLALTPTDGKFKQRFLVAYLYFATSVKKPWSSDCIPPINDTETQCTYKTLITVDPITHYSIVSQKFLTGSDECDWGGVFCDDEDNIRGLEFSMYHGLDQFVDFVACLLIHSCFARRWPQHDRFISGRCHDAPFLADNCAVLQRIGRLAAGRNRQYEALD
jgi:hypothetical protein